ncbi:AbrB/MazE/SpoVT family DNA-binding domain-containing protein [Candidatus Woesearchaeota archaeon]|nr:AbrB/MazE/SpoVT family DNA-binding domain-containing protein [Candidatus Woesearchaeota archaeon]
MKRKVIQIAESTQLVSLPRKWAQKNNIKKGDEIEISEEGNRLVVSVEKMPELKLIELDLEGLDRTSILYVIRSAYKMGYDEMHLKFNTPTAKHYRIGKEEKVISIIHEEVNRLAGIEIIQQKENFCIVKQLSAVSMNEFDTALRRIFLLLKDIINDMVKGMEKNDKVLIETVEEKHDTITKFVSFCLRLLNKYGYKDSSKTAVLYHIISTVDKIVDAIKYAERELMTYEQRLKKETIDGAKEIEKSIAAYCDLFYKFDFKKASGLYKNRDIVLKDILGVYKKLPGTELSILEKLGSTLELITDITESRMAFEY